MSAPGSRIAHYDILEELGRGGMGVVYKARDTKLNRTVALKFLPAQLTVDDDATERFVREAQAAAAIDHPNICSIHEISESDDGQTYIVMGYYGGQTLQQRIASGSIAPEEAANIASQIAAGLAAAHKAGIVHRDIKPGNVILADDGRVRILDFGLAKLATGVDITSDGSTSGTAAYMSPEQISGDEVDPRSDLWSLGVVLHEMLSGSRPFHGEYAQAVSYAIVNKDPDPIRSAALDAPLVLMEVVEKALRKDPAERFQSADEFVEALAPITSPAVVQGSFADFIKRPVVFLPLLLGLVALGLFGWKVYSDAAQVRWARKEALPKIVQLAEQRERAEAFRWVQRAKSYLEGDPGFEWAKKYVVGTAWFTTDPPGAEVWWKRYDESDDHWVSLGTTPIDSVPFPAEVVRARFIKEGYESLDRLVFAGRNEFALSPSGASPKDMVLVPGGAQDLFIVGIDHNPAQEYQTFLYDKYEVTNAKYKAFVDAGGYENAAYWAELPVPFEAAMERFRDRSGRAGPATWEAGSYPPGEENYPVAGVSWYEAMAYAAWAGKALPTVFHWNAAAWTPISYMIVPKSNLAGQGPEPVGSNEGMSRYDQYDLAGNVREWVYNAGRDGQRFILGGGWNDPSYAYNDAYSQDPLDRSRTNGFRTIEYLGEEPNLNALQAEIDQPYRDYSKEKPVSDAEFAAIRRSYEYDKTPLEAQVESVDDSNPVYTHEIITFDAAYGGDEERVTAHLYLPKSAEPPYQTIVYFPGSDAIHDRSYDEGSRFSLDFLDFLIRDGRAFMFPVYKGTYERGTDLNSDYAAETVFYKDHVNMWAKDFRRSIDYLETRDDIDTDNLAYFGWSWGAMLGPLMTSLEPRIKVQVLLVAGLMFQRALPEADVFNFLPRVTARTLMLNGRYDYFFPLETSQQPFFDHLGVPDDEKRMLVSEQGHTVTREQLMKESFAWLDRWLDRR